MARVRTAKRVTAAKRRAPGLGMGLIGIGVGTPTLAQFPLAVEA
jgi:hypothetical protein